MHKSFKQIGHNAWTNRHSVFVHPATKCIQYIYCSINFIYLNYLPLKKCVCSRAHPNLNYHTNLFARCDSRWWLWSMCTAIVANFIRRMSNIFVNWASYIIWWWKTCSRTNCTFIIKMFALALEANDAVCVARIFRVTFMPITGTFIRMATTWFDSRWNEILCFVCSSTVRLKFKWASFGTHLILTFSWPLNGGFVFGRDMHERQKIYHKHLVAVLFLCEYRSFQNQNNPYLCCCYRNNVID